VDDALGVGPVDELLEVARAVEVVADPGRVLVQHHPRPLRDAEVAHLHLAIALEIRRHHEIRVGRHSDELRIAGLARDHDARRASAVQHLVVPRRLDQVAASPIRPVVDAERFDLGGLEQDDLLARIEGAAAVDVVEHERRLAIAWRLLGEALGSAIVTRAVPILVGVEVVIRRIEPGLFRSPQRVAGVPIPHHAVQMAQRHGPGSEIDRVHRWFEHAVVIDVDPVEEPSVGAEEHGVRDVHPVVDVADRHAGAGEQRPLADARAPRGVSRDELCREVERPGRAHERAVEADALHRWERREERLGAHRGLGDQRATAAERGARAAEDQLRAGRLDRRQVVLRGAPLELDHQGNRGGAERELGVAEAPSCQEREPRVDRALPGCSRQGSRAEPQAQRHEGEHGGDAKRRAERAHARWIEPDRPRVRSNPFNTRRALR
jgi:hypothetical protein